MLVHDQQHHIHGLAADLETPAAFLEQHKRGTAPDSIRAAADQALAVLAANPERPLFERWNHRTARGPIPELFRNLLTRPPLLFNKPHGLPRDPFGKGL